MRVIVSAEAEAVVAAGGGTLWVWAERPAMCCGGTPVFLRASTERPANPAGFASVLTGPLDIRFRAPGGRYPDFLEIGLHGKRKPTIEAYWDGCLIVM